MRVSTCLLPVALAAVVALRGEPAPPAPEAAKRVPWSTSRVTGSPEAAPPYRTERAFPNPSSPCL